MAFSHREAYVGVDVILLDDQGRILLMKRAKRERSFPDTWGLVAGFVERNETAEEACRREAREEIGVEIGAVRFTGRIYSTAHPFRGTVVALPHYGKITAGMPHAADPEECQDVRWFTPTEVRSMTLAYDHKQMLADEGLI